MSMEQALYCFACGSQRITSQGCTCQTFRLSREQLIRMRDAWVLEASDQALTSSGDDVETRARELKPYLLCGLSWEQARNSLDAVDCAIRRPHWCSPVVILKDGEPVIDDDGDIKPFSFMRGDQRAHDWMMVPRCDDDGNEIEPTFLRALKARDNG